MSKCPENECPLRDLNAKVYPGTYQQQGRFRIIHEEVHAKEYYTEYFIECPKCKKEYSFTDEIGYHFPVYYYPDL